jgi:hypothetical protein
MLDNPSVTPVNDSALIEEISFYIYQAILEIQQQQPNLLREKYRNVPLHNPKNQSTFLAKLKEGFSKAQDQEALIINVQKFLQILLVSSYFKLPDYDNLIEKIHSSTQHLVLDSSTDVEHSQQVKSLTSTLSRGLPEPSGGIAILLLDAENLKLDVNTEKFLAEVCVYPIQIKVAFANWSKMGKQDVDFHGRGYELIHVPTGKDSADVKMATVGSSIFVHYPTAREVLVCSSDGVMTHLCNTLQTHGLTVYRVRKQADNLTVFNSKTNQTQILSLKPSLEIPSLEQAISQLKELIKVEQQGTNNPWIKLSKISKLFHTKYKLTISQVVSAHLPGKRARDIFTENSKDFVVHQPSDDAELYLTLFEVNHPDTVSRQNGVKEIESKTNSSPSPGKINSRVELEQALIKLLTELTIKSPGSYIGLSTLGTQFSRQYHQPITKMMKSLQLNGNFIKFLQSCSYFKLKQTDKEWQVAIAQP